MLKFFKQNFKKVTALLLALIMTLSIGAVTFAADLNIAPVEDDADFAVRVTNSYVVDGVHFRLVNIGGIRGLLRYLASVDKVSNFYWISYDEDAGVQLFNMNDPDVSLETPSEKSWADLNVTHYLTVGDNGAFVVRAYDRDPSLLDQLPEINMLEDELPTLREGTAAVAAGATLANFTVVGSADIEGFAFSLEGDDAGRFAIGNPVGTLSVGATALTEGTYKIVVVASADEYASRRLPVEIVVGPAPEALSAVVRIVNLGTPALPEWVLAVSLSDGSSLNPEYDNYLYMYLPDDETWDPLEITSFANDVMGVGLLAQFQYPVDNDVVVLSIPAGGTTVVVDGENVQVTWQNLRNRLRNDYEKSNFNPLLYPEYVDLHVYVATIGL